MRAIRGGSLVMSFLSNKLDRANIDLQPKTYEFNDRCCWWWKPIKMTKKHGVGRKQLGSAQCCLRGLLIPYLKVLRFWPFQSAIKVNRKSYATPRKNALAQQTVIFQIQFVFGLIINFGFAITHQLKCQNMCRNDQAEVFLPHVSSFLSVKVSSCCQQWCLKTRIYYLTSGVTLFFLAESTT